MVIAFTGIIPCGACTRFAKENVLLRLTANRRWYNILRTLYHIGKFRATEEILTIFCGFLRE